MFALFRTAAILFALLTLVTGVLYPVAVTAVASVAFPHQAAGSLVQVDGRDVGSSLIGQAFSDPGHFWSRPSAAANAAYNSMGGSGSNLATTNPALVDAVSARIAALRTADPDNDRPIPVDLVTASASGLDPHISPAAAEYQLGRVARARGMNEDELRNLVTRATEQPTVGLLGQPRVNVLQLNLSLDGLKKRS